MESDITFYSTHCPQCMGIQAQLNRKNIKYTEVNDKQKMIELGFKTSPVLVVGGNTYLGAKSISDYLKTV